MSLLCTSTSVLRLMPRSSDLLRRGVGALQDSVRHLLTQQRISWSNLDSLPWKR